MAQSLAPNSTSTSQQIASIDRRLSDSVAAILNTATKVGSQTVVTVLPSPALRREVEIRLAAVNRSLAPIERSAGERERAARAVAAVLSGWVTAKVADPASKVAAYIGILGDLPCWVIEEICRDVARGKVADVSPDFPPSAARLHQLGEEVVARLRKEAADLEAVKNAKLKADPEHTPDERRRLELKFKSLSAEISGKPNGEAAPKMSAKLDPAVHAAAQERVRAEYAALGREPPSSYALSPATLRETAEREALREEYLRRDRQAGEASE